MNYQNTRLRNMLAAEYALGTLQGKARKRFERLLAEDSRLQELVEIWQGHLAEVHLPRSGVRPPKRVWKKIEQQIFEASARHVGWWDNLHFWRGASMASSVLAVILAVVVFVKPVQHAPDAIALLGNQHISQAWMVACSMKDNRLSIKTMGYNPHPSLKPELWAVVDGRAYSLGFLPDQGQLDIPMDSKLAKLIMHADKLNVTMEEEQNQSDHPTTEVVYSGKMINL